MRAANQYKVPLFPISTGKNYAYGGASANLRGSVIVDLKRMNKVLEVDENRHFARVEPGVSYFDLYRYIQDNKLKVMIDPPIRAGAARWATPSTRGSGYTMGTYRDHASAAVGLEVVLANGEVMRTGMGASTNAKSWNEHPVAFGPDPQGLFFQGNFGIVTKMRAADAAGRALPHRPADRAQADGLHPPGQPRRLHDRPADAGQHLVFEPAADPDGQQRVQGRGRASGRGQSRRAGPDGGVRQPAVLERGTDLLRLGEDHPGQLGIRQGAAGPPCAGRPGVRRRIPSPAAHQGADREVDLVLPLEPAPPCGGRRPRPGHLVHGGADDRSAQRVQRDPRRPDVGHSAQRRGGVRIPGGQRRPGPRTGRRQRHQRALDPRPPSNSIPSDGIALGRRAGALAPRTARSSSTSSSGCWP